MKDQQFKILNFSDLILLRDEIQTRLSTLERTFQMNIPINYEERDLLQYKLNKINLYIKNTINEF